LCRPIKKKKPITPEEMMQLFKSLNTENRTLKDLRVLAMLAISYMFPLNVVNKDQHVVQCKEEW
jgi:hypothetical protein